MQPIDTPSLRLEPQTAAHADEMFPLLADGEVYRYLDGAPPSSLDALRGRFERLETRRSPDSTELWLNWVVRALESATHDLTAMERLFVRE